MEVLWMAGAHGRYAEDHHETRRWLCSKRAARFWRLMTRARPARLIARDRQALRQPSIWLARLLRNTDGATAIEYGLISVLVAVGCYTMLSDTAHQSGAAIQSIDAKMAAANNPPPQTPDDPLQIPPPPFGWPNWNGTRPTAAPAL